MKRKGILVAIGVLALVAAVLTGCGGSTEAATTTPTGELTWVWYPNESAPEFAPTRAAVIKTVSDAIGRPIKEQLTTDYAIAIEAIVNDNAAFSWFGGEGYIQAHEKNPAILPLVVNSGSDGKLSSAKYYAMFGVLTENAAQYMQGGEYTIDSIAGKRFSFVSSSSTSGYRVPSAFIVGHFSAKSEWATLKSEDLLEGGRGMLFNEVMFGGSHQGAFYNILVGRADVAAFCDECVAAYVEQVSGPGRQGDPRAGDLYRVRQGADAPFDTLPGKEYVLISTIPVLNAPIVVNTGLLTSSEMMRVVAALTSDETAGNESIFAPRGASFRSFFQAGQRFLPVTDAWFNPIRELAGS